MPDSDLVRKLTDALIRYLHTHVCDEKGTLCVNAGTSIDAIVEQAAEVVREYVEGLVNAKQQELDERLMIEFIANGELATEAKRLEQQVSKLRTALSEIADFSYCASCASCPTCNPHAIARAALSEGTSQ